MEAAVLKTVLLADDDADDRIVFKDALDTVMPEASLETANNGMEVMLYLNDKIPDIIFLDINMPLRNGIECIKSIRELKQFRHLPVVAYSSAFNVEEINKAYAFGAHLYLIKPTRFSFLIEDLNHLFALDWTEPNIITSDHFIDNHYKAFNERREF